MPVFQFFPLPYAEWQETLDTLTKYARILSEIRFFFTPKQKHYWSLNLQVSACGLTTTPIPAGESQSAVSFEMQLDFTAHKLSITTNHGAQSQLPLTGQPPAALFRQTQAVLANFDIHPKIDANEFPDTPGHYDKTAVERYWQALCQIDLIFRQFKSELRTESGPVSFWTHHFDLDLLWFSGRRVPGQDPNNAEHADEQMGFGFKPGDEEIPEPYFYITAYPLPEELPKAKMPEDAVWNTEGWQGAVLRYEKLVGIQHPEKKLLDFLRGVHRAALDLMK